MDKPEERATDAPFLADCKEERSETSVENKTNLRRLVQLAK